MTNKDELSCIVFRLLNGREKEIISARESDTIPDERPVEFFCRRYADGSYGPTYAIGVWQDCIWIGEPHVGDDNRYPEWHGDEVPRYADIIYRLCFCDTEMAYIVNLFNNHVSPYERIGGDFD